MNRAAGERITLNVGGARFSTYPATLRAFPESTLWRLTQPRARAEFDYDPQAGEFFFDRDGRAFAEVLSYCRTGRLHCAGGVCGPVLEEELRFWGVGDAPLAPCCCWQRGAQEDEPGGACDAEDGDDVGLLVAAERPARAGWRPRLWTCFEKPFSSPGAKCLAAVSLLFNAGVCALFVGKATCQLEFVPSAPYSGYYHNGSAFQHRLEYSFYRQCSYLLYLELLAALWFLAEFALRLACCPARRKFLRNPLNAADFAALFPAFVELCAGRRLPGTPRLLYWLDLVRAVYFLKLLKALRLVETPLMLRVLPHTFRALLREVGVLLLVVGVEVLFFGALCFFAELVGEQEDAIFSSLLSGFWWAAVTLTTVGYGDVFPVSAFGKGVAVATAVCGVLTIVVPVPVFLVRFQGHYKAAVLREKRKRRAREALGTPA